MCRSCWTGGSNIGRGRRIARWDGDTSTGEMMKQVVAIIKFNRNSLSKHKDQHCILDKQNNTRNTCIDGGLWKGQSEINTTNIFSSIHAGTQVGHGTFKLFLYLKKKVI
jgi:hypothetical protein